MAMINTALRFQLLQQWQKRATTPVVFFLFDLLWSDGHNLTGKTVVRRRKRLREIITAVDGLLGLLIFLLAAMDNPFRGEIGVGPEAFELAYKQLMQPGK